MLPGLITGSIVCSLLQFGYNELGIARIKYLARNKPEAEAEPTRRRTLGEVTQDFLEWSGLVRRISDEEYLRRLKRQREDILVRIAELEGASHKTTLEESEEKQDSS